MKKIFIASWVICLCTVIGYAQPDSLRVKKVDHFIGVQVNELIKQVFNLNDNNNSVIDNPYLLTYALMFIKCKWGVHTGVGYRYSSVAAKESNNETKLNDVFYRIGVIRKSMIGKKIQVGYGLDYTGEYHGDVTTSFLVSGSTGSGIIDSTYSKVTANTNTLGGGAHLELSVYLTPRVLLGTETNYYFLKSTTKENTLVTTTIVDLFAGVTFSDISNFNDKTEAKEFAITVPVGIFLIVKF